MMASHSGLDAQTTRRSALLSALAWPLARAMPYAQLNLAAEGYIFQQYATRLGKPLRDLIDEALSMASAAGFHQLELNPAFFAADLRERTVAKLRSLDLRMPSIYVGGPMHERAGAEKTTRTALEYARLAAPFGCQAVVNNPDPKTGESAKTDDELAVEAESLNRMGKSLAREGFELRIHHHTPQLENHAREWRYLLAHTDPAIVHVCVDVDWAYQGGFEPVPFLREVGTRLRELHIRSARNKLWLEEVTDSDIDYRQVAAYLKEQKRQPLLVVELAYKPETVVTRKLEEDLRRSRAYTESVFG